jgi:hypothetical protein
MDFSLYVLHSLCEFGEIGCKVSEHNVSHVSSVKLGVRCLCIM